MRLVLPGRLRTGWSMSAVMTAISTRVDSQTRHGEVEVPDGRPGRSSPAVSGGVVYFGSMTAISTPLDTQTGAEKWKFKTDDAGSASPVISGGVVYFGGWGPVLSRTPTSTRWTSRAAQEKWKFKTGSGFGVKIDSSPAISDGVAYFSNSDGYLYAVDIQSGRQKWKFQTAGDMWSTGLSPAISDGVVYFGSPDGYLYALDSQSGTEKWKFQTGGPIGTSPGPLGGSGLFR